MTQQSVLDRAAVALTAAAGALAIIPQSRVARVAHRSVVQVLGEIDATPSREASADDALLLRAMIESAISTLTEMLRVADEAGVTIPLRQRVDALLGALAEHAGLNTHTEEMSRDNEIG